jgi:hypothetical protein
VCLGGLSMFRRSIERSRCRYNRGSCTETEYIGRGLQTATTLNLLRGGVCWLFGGIVRYRLSSQQKVHRCNSVLEKGKSMRGDNSFYFLQLSIIYGIILRLIYSTSYQITHAPWCHIRKGESIPTE